MANGFACQPSFAVTFGPLLLLSLLLLQFGIAIRFRGGRAKRCAGLRLFFCFCSLLPPSFSVCSAGVKTVSAESGLALAGSCQYLDAIRLDIWRATASLLTDY
jgi:hypothetical protein